MNPASFIRLVEHPATLADTDITELRLAVQQFPYCASAHMLLLKKYQLDHHPDFDARLALTAAYANDRKALYRLLYDDSKFAKPIPIERQPEPEPEVKREQKVEQPAVATYDAFDHDREHWADGMRVLERESADALSFELKEQVALANDSGVTAEVNHDFDNLDEENDESLVDEKHDVELESTVLLEGAIEHAAEEHTHDASPIFHVPEKTNGTLASHESKLQVEEDVLANSEAPALPLENVPTVDVPEQLNELPLDPLERSNMEHAESPSPKEELATATEGADEEGNETQETEPTETFEESEEESVEETVEDNIGHETLTEAESDAVGMSMNDLPSVDEPHQNEFANVTEETALPTSLEEHKIDPKSEIVSTDADVTTTAELTPRHEINPPIAEEDLTGEAHVSQPSSEPTPQRRAEPVHATPQPLEGKRSFTDWLRLLEQRTETRPEIKEKKERTKIKDTRHVAQPRSDKTLQENDRASFSDVQVNPSQTEPSSIAEHDDDELYDRDAQAKRLEMQSWTAGMPDELKAIDEYVHNHAADAQPKPNISVAELAQRSLRESDAFNTETMARVYAAQGKYKKAIDILEKLMLANPSKSAYFADLLHELKTKTNP